MRTALQKSAIPESQIYMIKDLREKHFDPVWHAHSEYQLFVVLEGTGTRFIGDSIQSFKAGELILTGPHLPHLWRSDEKYFEKKGPLRTRGIMVYLDEHFLGRDMLTKVELHRLKNLFGRSLRGIEFYGESRLLVIELMKELLTMDGIGSLIHLLKILDILSCTREYRYISSRPYSNSINEQESNRLNQVYDHIIKNFRNKIPLKTMADMLHMTPTSFSRYFSMKNNKTYSRFVTEIRLKHACELLTNTDRSVAEICYDCGFNTLSNFNKQFKEIVGKKPINYKKEFTRIHMHR